MNSINPNKEVFSTPSPIAQLSTYSDLMAFTLKFLSSQEAMKSRVVCTRWNELISTQCIGPILYRELELQVVPFLQHIGKTLEQYFSERGIPLSSINSVKDAYHYLGPIKWKVYLGECLSVGNLPMITPESLLENIQNHFVTKSWGEDYDWRQDLYTTLLKFGCPTSTWNQLALAVGVPVEEWNRQLKNRASYLHPDIAVAQSVIKQWEVKPDEKEPDFNPLVALEKINAFAHNKIKGAPYFELCPLSNAKPPESASKFAFINDSYYMRDDALIYFRINDQVLYDHFPCNLLGFKPQDYVGKNLLALLPAVGKDVCFPINGQFFKFTICQAQVGERNDEKGPKGDCDSSSDDDFLIADDETCERKVEYNGWQCLTSGLYIPEDECERSKITRL
jgi:hypothetical protein